MNELPTHVFTLGDIVEITVTFRHKPMWIKKVSAIFVNEQDPFEIPVDAQPQLVAKQSEFGSAGLLRSHADFNIKIPAEATPGIYSLKQLELITYGGKSYRYEGEKLGEPIVKFKVVPEPDESPIIEGSGYTKPS